jgi:hypothetical protein
VCASSTRRWTIYNNLATVVDGLPFHPDNDGTIKLAWLAT